MHFSAEALLCQRDAGCEALKALGWSIQAPSSVLVCG
jgi:hypothetical protein